MPRDLQAERDGLPTLSPQQPTGMMSREAPMDVNLEQTGSLDRPASLEEAIKAVKHLHPYASLLSLSDVDSCLKLEEATFPENQRATREKIQYRLGACGELCLGLFSPAEPHDDAAQAATASTANTNDSTQPQRKGVLLGHIIATKTRNELVSDDDMKIPQSGSSKTTEEAGIGHQEDGRTIAIHSLAVLPGYQRKGLGTLLLKEYIQRMEDAETAETIAILTYDRLVPWYETAFGFEKKGQSSASFGGGDWVDMVLDFADPKVRAMNLDESSSGEDD